MALVEDLEDREWEPGEVVPPLLEAVEEIAASRAEDGDALRHWSEQIAERLRVPQALKQCRLAAKRRAARRPTLRPVLRVWLWPQPPGDNYCFVMRLYDGRGAQIETWSARDVPRPHTDLCRDLAEAVDELEYLEESAGVEFLLEEGSFGLAVDRWPVLSGVLGPRPLGVDRMVVLRGQRPVRRPDVLKARWEQRQAMGRLPHVLHDSSNMQSALDGPPNVSCVIACCPPEQRIQTLAMCRWLSVPVVLWHREAHGPDAEAVLRPVVRDDWPDTLREEVRRLRLAAGPDTTHEGAHLALLWEDPNWTPPRKLFEIPTTRGDGVA